MNIKNKLVIGAGMLLGLAGSANAQKLDYVKSINVNYQTSEDIKENKVYESSFDFSKPLEDELQNKISGKDLNVYFQTGKDNFTKGDSLDLVKYIDSFEKAPKNILIKSSADARGDSQENYYLSNRRSKTSKEIISKRFPKTNIETIVIGEYGTLGELGENRKTQIIPCENSVQNAIESSKTDYYLIDLSGSMNKKMSDGKSIIDAVRSVKFPAESKVFVYSGKDNSNNLSEIEPFGPTPLHNASYEMIQSVMRDSSSLTTFSDGANTGGGPTPGAIINFANSKGIKLSTVAYNIPYDKKHVFQEMSKETGGKSTLIN